MNTKKSQKRKRGRQPLVEGDLDAAAAVTSTMITETRPDGSTVTKRVLVPLHSPVKKRPSPKEVLDGPSGEFEQDDIPPPQERPNINRGQRDYLREYVERIDEILEALLSREALPNAARECRFCDMGMVAAWRCCDCNMGIPMCRTCMRGCHKQNPFHHIEHWNGNYFRPAALSEVGTYLLVPHHLGHPLCDVLNRHTLFLESVELRNDSEEQVSLQSALAARPRDVPSPDEIVDHADEDNMSDEQLLQYLQGLQQEDAEADGQDGIAEVDDDGVETDEDGQDIPSINPSGIEHTSTPFMAIPGTYVRVVHTNGIHDLAMVTCQCRGDSGLPLDLFGAGLLPASFQRIRTLFTTQGLDHFRLCNLELKASAYQFYQLLRRLTRPTAPAEVVDLYREFRRMSRLWRWMKKLRWAGYGIHGRKATNIQSGELGIYCPACPQPGINIQESWVYKRIFVADGNFKADHVRQHNPVGDIWLSEGGGMIPDSKEYMDFLHSAIERQTKAPCETTFRAIMNALQASKACDVTGIVGIACARHGCYAPNALVDLFKGEQQKNVDFALLKALTSTRVSPEQGVLLIYDIACQYFVHLRDRIGSQLPSGLDIEAGIGLFHVHAHKDECFFRYSPSFIPGAGVVAGEILESLWSSLNSISPTARTATLPHRAEILDDHASDSNHKKCLGMVSTLCKNYQRAVDMLDHAQKYHQNLTKEAGDIAVAKWANDIRAAEGRRQTDISDMDIYGAKLDTAVSGHLGAAAAPSETAHDSWMQLSLKLEEQQLDIRAQVRQLGRNPGMMDGIDKQRQSLSALFVQLKTAQQAAGVSELNIPQMEDSVSLHIWEELENEGVPSAAGFGHDIGPGPSGDRPSSEGDMPNIEDQRIPFPSNGTLSQSYGQLELSHRIVRAEHYLTRIRELIAQKSFQYSHVVRVSPNKGVTTRARASVKKLNAEIAGYCRKYTYSRASLIRLGADAAIHGRLRPLTPDDIKASSAIVNPNEPGSTKLKLSWIWLSAGGQRMGLAGGSDHDVADVADAATILEFRRVHWLRSRAQYMRWAEEVTLLGYEMQWTIRFFKYKSEEWATRIIGHPAGREVSAAHAGAVAYATRKQAMWHHMMTKGDRIFTLLNNAYISLKMPIHTIRAFNPFNLHHGPVLGRQLMIQEVIDYAESRFRSIIVTISKADIDAQSWTQKLLRRELMFVLSYVGMAYATGQKLHIPIVLQSLTDSIAMLADDALPVPLDPNFLAVLDIGRNTTVDRTPMIKDYRLRWWTGRKPRHLDNVDIMTDGTLVQCLDYHRRQLDQSPLSSPAASPPAMPSHIPPVSSPHDGTPCTKCPIYKATLSDLLQEVLGIHQYASTMATTAEAEWQRDMRRASTFHDLHTAALNKEIDTPPLPAMSRSQHAKAASATAQAEFERLTALPPTSHKWTWGQTLTQQDVLALRKMPTTPHSDYDLDMPAGRESGEYSSEDTMPSSNGRHDDVPLEATAPLPDSTVSLPSFFDGHTLLYYSPLHSSVNTPSGVDPTDGRHHADGPAADDVATSLHQELAEDWTSGEDDVHPAVAMLPGPNVAATTTTNVDMADVIATWQSASDNDDALSNPGQELDVTTWTSEHDSDDDADGDEDAEGEDGDGEDGEGGDTEEVHGEVAVDSADVLLPAIIEHWDYDADDVGHAAIQDTALGDDYGTQSHVATTWSPAPSSSTTSEALAMWQSDGHHSATPSVPPRSPASSTIAANSQYVASPSRITLRDPPPFFSDIAHQFPDNFSDGMASPSRSNTFSTPVRQYGPEDFAFLQETMFDDWDDEDEDDGAA